MSGTYLITGGTGSFGKTMLEELLNRDVEKIVIFSRDEEKQFHLRNKLNDDRVVFRVGDVRDYESVERAMNGVDYVFHAAALKQVPSCEFFPEQAVYTNIDGSKNVINAAVHMGVKSVVCLSTDKAVFPVNAMGMSKAMMEKIAGAAARELGDRGNTIISTVRYGNVLCSRGSVVPLFMDQVKASQPITITVPDMTRFLMPLRDAVSLVMFAFENAKQGDLFIRKAPSATIADLAEAVKLVMGKPDHPTNIIGWRHGEKLFETLASAQELGTAEDLDDYWRITNDNRDLNYGKFFDVGESGAESHADFDSHTSAKLSVNEIAELLKTLPEVTQSLASE